MLIMNLILNPGLQLVLDDSERIRHALQDFRPALDEISAVCDITTHEERVNQNDQQVKKMQCKILEPLEQLLQAVVVRMFFKERNFGLFVTPNGCERKALFPTCWLLPLSEQIQHLTSI